MSATAAARHTLTAVEHAASWLVGTVANLETSLHDLEARDPLVAQALAAGEALAAEHGVPVAAGEAALDGVLATAKQMAHSLATVPAVEPTQEPEPEPDATPAKPAKSRGKK